VAKSEYWEYLFTKFVILTSTCIGDPIVLSLFPSSLNVGTRVAFRVLCRKSGRMDCDSIMHNGATFEKSFVMYLKRIGEGFARTKIGNKKVLNIHASCGRSRVTICSVMVWCNGRCVVRIRKRKVHPPVLLRIVVRLLLGYFWPLSRIRVTLGAPPNPPVPHLPLLQ